MGSLTRLCFTDRIEPYSILLNKTCDIMKMIHCELIVQAPLCRWDILSCSQEFAHLRQTQKQEVRQKQKYPKYRKTGGQNRQLWKTNMKYNTGLLILSCKKKKKKSGTEGKGTHLLYNGEGWQ